MRFARFMLLLTASPFMLLLPASPGFATKYAEPKRHDVFSHSRAFVLDVNPESEVHTVYDVRDRNKPLWSFSKPVWHYPFLLSDDGRVVATVAWKHVTAEKIGETTAVTLWNKDGAFREYPLKDMCPDPPKTKDVGGGPIGDFWRTWYTDVVDDGESFTILTTRKVEYRFRYAGGELVERRQLAGWGWGGLVERRQLAGWRRWGGLALTVLLVVSSAAIALWRRRSGGFRRNEHERLGEREVQEH